LLVSHQGVHGGYELAQPPAATSVAAVLEAIDGPLTMTAPRTATTKAINPLRRIRDRIAAILAECSILEIAADPDSSAPPVRVMSSPAMRRVAL
jgi:DNA-binding IscR family transcriptional regulator